MTKFFNHKKVTIIFFLFIFLFGFKSVKNFGISYDEPEYRNQGLIVLNYLGTKFFPKLTNKISEERNLNFAKLSEYHSTNQNNYKFHNTIFAAIEYLFYEKDEKRTKYLFRHYLNYTFNFLSLIFFYKVLRISYSRFYSLFGVCLFLTSPKILPDFINSPNDIWLLTSLMISYYYSRVFFEKNKFKYLIFFSIFLCLAINIRFIALYLLAIFLFFYFILENNKPKFLINSIFTLILIYIISIFITPQLWINPFNFFNLFLNQLSFNPIDPKIMFLGELINSSSLPWFYLFLWIIISTPTLLLFCFIIGNIFLLINSKNFFKFKNKELIICYLDLLMLFIPLLAFIIFRPSIFNGWRHFYFIYPYFLLIAIFGITQIMKLNFRKNIMTKIKYILILFFSIHLLTNIYFIFQSHPYQNIYFNIFSKKYAKNFELDYFGISNYQALNRILEKNNDNNKKIIVSGLNSSRPDVSAKFLNKENYERLEFKNLKKNNNLKNTYFISHYLEGYNEDKLRKENFIVWEEIYANDIKINTIYKYQKN